MAELLAKAARHFPIYAFSNTNETHKAVMLSRFAEILVNFRTVFISSDLGARKPDRRAFELVAKEMDASLDQILLFDDTQENIDGANACGMQTVLVKSLADVKEALDARIT
jgi:putative hydrolase of the HAD superfamily